MIVAITEVFCSETFTMMLSMDSAVSLPSALFICSEISPRTASYPNTNPATAIIITSKAGIEKTA